MTASARTTDLILPSGLTAIRPAPETVPAGSLYPSTDDQTIYRNNDTGTAWEPWLVIGDFSAYVNAEEVRDIIAAMLKAGANVTLTNSDATDELTIAAAPTDPEVVRDAVGTALVAGTGVTITVDDAANTVTIAADASGMDAEAVRDLIGSTLVAGTNVTLTVDDAANTVTINAAGGGGGGGATTLDGLTDVDLTVPPSLGHALLFDGTSWKSKPVGSVVWTRKVTADPMDTNTRWTPEGGVWTFGGAYGVQQTQLTDNAWLRLTANPGAEVVNRLIRCKVRSVSGSILGVGFAGGGVWGSGAIGVGLDFANNTIWYDRYGTGGGSTAKALARDTDYELMVLERKTREFWVYVNGVLSWTFTPNADQAAGGIGLYARQGVGWFRDVSVWEGVTRFDLPADL